ncbi:MULTISPECIES: MDR family MFS transporter [Bacillus cereus group]|uniref:MFS transporter n=1 Tax=Bacillus cereus TaxID=1396 RepID=A0AA44TGP0_BACCE|nr:MULTISPECIES: MDR family MFS transporter [Bacillus cereus group]EEL49569.1 MFS family major facilitator transporter [Bacillus cereus Rock3-44]PFA24098.1 MFS transporter [Bacillus cereus]PFN09536.1 MFS transporter [Bacillus cereus]PFO81444.1 MFS transporter [Bacillus cereus]PFR23184.1 MFS transporter [Bacillus cereus]
MQEQTSQNKVSKTKFVVAGLLLGILMAAMDNTIVATAMATIVGDLGGFDKFVWVTSAYMVATMAGMPIFGKLSDMYGRKRFYIGGLLLFLLGSILCGTATSIEQLSIYRAIQGIGGGALMPIAFTIMYDIFPPEKRGKMTGLFGAVFGTSSVFGPLLGAYITDYISWHWVFYINIPLGLISFIFISKYYKESLQYKKQKIDWAGAVTLVISIVCLMFALELGGKEYAWNSNMILGLFTTFAIMLLIFFFVERRAIEPIISFHLFKKRLFAASQGVAFFYGAAFIICTVYIPIFIQGVLGGSASNAGLILTPMMVGSVIGSQTGGQLASRTSYRNIMIVSGIFFVLGIYLLSTLTMDTPRTLVTLFMILAGLGVGFSFSVLSMSSIHNLDMRDRGSATSTNSFFRSLGMTLGVTIFGTIQNHIFTDKLKTVFPPELAKMAPKSGDTSFLLSPNATENIPPQILDGIKQALATSIADTFFWALIPATLSIICITMMGKERLLTGITKKQKQVS